MKKLIQHVGIFIFCSVILMFVAGRNGRLVSFSVMEDLAEGWKMKVDEAVCELMGLSSTSKQCHWIVYTNTAGERWQSCIFWGADQLGDTSLTNISELLSLKIPAPFRAKVIANDGRPEDIGLYEYVQAGETNAP